MRALWISALLLPSLVLAQDMRVITLEQDVRNLERQVQTLTRQLDELRLQMRDTGPSPQSARERTNTTSPRDWLNAANWRRIQPGMSEFDVIDALGPPTSMREEEGHRVLLYAMEIGASGFLGGSVTLADRKVLRVEMPTLK